jgi:hypothetical protein
MFRRLLRCRGKHFKQRIVDPLLVEFGGFMNGYEKAQALGITGTDAEIVAVLKTLTVSNIAVDAVRVWLRENLLWFRSSPTTMGGAIQQVIESPSTPDETKQQLGIFWSAVFGDGAQNLLTTVPTWAGLVWHIIQGLTQATPDAAALVDSFYALDGGRPHKDLTVEQFAAQRTAAETEAATVAARNERRALYDAFENAIGTLEQAEKISEMRTMLDAVEAG